MFRCVYQPAKFTGVAYRSFRALLSRGASQTQSTSPRVPSGRSELTAPCKFVHKRFSGCSYRAGRESVMQGDNSRDNAGQTGYQLLAETVYCATTADIVCVKQHSTGRTRWSTSAMDHSMLGVDVQQDPGGEDSKIRYDCGGRRPVQITSSIVRRNIQDASCENPRSSFRRLGMIRIVRVRAVQERGRCEEQLAKSLRHGTNTTKHGPCPQNNLLPWYLLLSCSLIMHQVRHSQTHVKRE